MARVLIVEDDALLGELLSASLAARGGEFDVAMATSVEGAMRSLGTRAFDIVLVDLMLPDGDGIDLARRAKAIDPGVHVVLMTGSPSTAAREKAHREGVALFLEKPIDLQVLRAAFLSFAAPSPQDPIRHA